MTYPSQDITSDISCWQQLRNCCFWDVPFLLPNLRILTRTHSPDLHGLAWRAAILSGQVDHYIPWPPSSRSAHGEISSCVIDPTSRPWRACPHSSVSITIHQSQLTLVATWRLSCRRSRGRHHYWPTDRFGCWATLLVQRGTNKIHEAVTCDSLITSGLASGEKMAQGVTPARHIVTVYL